jgi:UDP-N-acetylmuramoylalanine-D-glutamate ligase
MTIETLALQGRDTLHTGLAGIDTARLKAIRNASLRACFNRLEDTRYRLEFVARILGREYVNDAASRTINATWYSLESTEGGIIWIACGSDSEADYSRLVPLALRKVRMLLILGDDSRLRKTFSGIIPTIQSCDTMAQALHHAYMYEAVDVKVLFSPACDDGVTTEAWGEEFRREVNEL